ncbi:class I histocompatibility antigen, F10 alpha chain-like isoform X6 [Strix uralensis]|uniref:class I histocompatibility antigen, F10 alpha chain-like isoform X6 n=1 Tax=Strix uralensis TaxID=36305 RepID=UPI003DA79489
MRPGRALGLGLLLGVLGAAASGPHSLRFFHVAVSEPSPGVPEYMFLGYVDGNLISRYDSDMGRAVPRADWMEKILDGDHWDILTKNGQRNQEMYRMNMDTVRGRYNQSGRGQTLQRMYGCDILEDGSSRGLYQTAYDGQDFIALDTNTMTLTATDTTARMSKRECEAGTGFEQLKHFLGDTCIEWLGKYVSYGRAVLERKEPPTVRVSGKEADGLLTLYCRAYGFYPRPIAVSWLKGGEVRDQETERGSVAPNSDGTYYTWASIEARPEEKDEYRCRVEHASLPEPGLFAWEPESNLLAIVLGVVIAVVAVITIIAGLAVWKSKSGKKNKDYNMAPSSDGGSGSSATGTST